MTRVTDAADCFFQNIFVIKLKLRKYRAQEKSINPHTYEHSSFESTDDSKSTLISSQITSFRKNINLKRNIFSFAKITYSL